MTLTRQLTSDNKVCIKPLQAMFELELLRRRTRDKIVMSRGIIAIALRHLVEIKVGWNRRFLGVAKNV
jgi:hypothetical protein